MSRSMRSVVLLVGAIALALTACTKTYTQRELIEEEVKAQDSARGEVDYDREIGQLGGENVEGIRRQVDEGIRDTSR